MQAILLNGPQAQSASLFKSQPEAAEDSDEGTDDAPVTGYGGGHGVRKTILDPAAAAAKLAKDTQRAQAYKELSDTVNAMRHAEDYSSDAFANTLALLKLNPEYYTIWNYRRNIFLKGLFPACDKDAQAKQDLITSELKLLQAILQDYPKVYCLWVHRKWCLGQCPWPDWQRELMLVTRMLEQDARNFHVWEYRRYVVGQLEQAEERSLAEREFEYTTAAISHNFSNFSAWHNRTKLIPTLLLEAGDTADVREGRRAQLLKDELTLLKDALFTDPDDQSVWLYHKWLLNPDSGPAEQFPLAPQDVAARIALLQQELEMIDALLEEEPGHVWCLDARCVY
ncbi:rab geranylgeranyltransferase alpha subunit, partial [Protomyces lactucae-debilis]